MSIVDYNQIVIVPYSLDKTFKALEKVVIELKDFKIERIDDVMKNCLFKSRYKCIFLGRKYNGFFNFSF